MLHNGSTTYTLFTPIQKLKTAVIAAYQQAVEVKSLCSKCLHATCIAYACTLAAAGDHHCLLLDHSGCVWAMGSNQHGQLGLPPQQAAAAASGAADKALETASDSQQALHTGCFVAVLGPASGSKMQEQVQQVRV
jgi:hypothetical protein